MSDNTPTPTIVDGTVYLQADPAGLDTPGDPIPMFALEDMPAPLDR